MWKPLWVLAVLASTFFVTILAGSASSYASSCSSISSSSSSSSAISSSTAYKHTHKRDRHVKPKCTKPNEEYDVCPVLCPPRECGVNIALILCIVPPQPGDPECEPGCRCSDGYLRNSTGICIPENDCPKCTKPNEVYDECPALCPPRRCDVDERVIRCKAPPKPGDPECEPGCRCADGYYRNDDDVCVTRDQCPSKCGDHEEHVECPPAVCRPKECTDLGFPIPCPDLGSQGCPEDPACICEDGYAKDKYGVCVPWEKCPSCGGDPNAVSGCGIHCNRHCSDINKPAGACPAVCLYNGCDCKKGFYYDVNIEKCVRPEHCTPTCKKDEVYSTCIDKCQPQNCSQLGFPIACSASNDDCVSGCKCKDGYLRADNGTCIPVTECPSCGGDPHAVSGCGVNCNKHCSDLNQPPGACILICHVNSCDCKDGFYFDDHTKTCVLPKQCTPECKKKHEVYSNCVNGDCGPRKCSDLGFPQPCPDLDESACVGGCVCESGYVYDDNGNCIPEKKCPSCGGDPNAESGCGVHCGRRCSNYNKGPVPCPRICFPNACDCKEDFVLDDNIKKCVLPKHCTPVCKDHEVYSDCINGGCQAKNCSQLGKPVPCVKIDPAYCIKGCLCEEGYLRARNGSCVPEDKCDNCNGPHEVWDSCPRNCPPQTCESIGKTYSCPAQPQACKGACRCEKGYYRNKIGECVSEKDCLKCQGPNEYFSCGGACDNVCATLHEQNQTNCLIVNIVCNPMCYCEKDYARDDNGICVPIDKCPKPKCKKKHEVYSNCVNGDCEPRKCSDLGFPQPCPDVDKSACVGGCVCESGYIYDDNGHCIPKKKCPSCGGDPHAVSGCGVNCNKHCSELHGPPKGCPKICRVNACDCKEDYYLDDNTKKCVLPKQCTPACKDHEVYSDCINGGCQAKNCSQLGKPVPCVKIDPAYCIKGCLCEEGYLRARNGTCVPEDECDKPVCKKHEIYDTCANGGCSKRNCSQIDEPEKCIRPIKCLGGCVCAKGYLRNSKGICVSEDQCPQKCHGANEYYDSCPPNCPPQTCESIGKKYHCPLIKTVAIDCQGACRCKKGFYRNKIGNCISEEDCLKCQGPNEYFSCGGACDNVCATLHEQNQTKCPIVNIVCNSMCYCEKDYARDDNGICVPIDECPKPPCGKNEIYVQCPATLCAPQNCSQVGFPIPCPSPSDPSHCPGPPGCTCNDGYVRNNAGICIPIELCPSCGGDTNAVSGCGTNTGKLCSNYHSKGPIAFPPACKYNACDCRDGFVYDKTIKKCVRPEDCKKCQGPHEYFSCGGACDNVCATLHEQNQTNCPIVNIKCNPMCYCEKGYARDKNNICVPIDKCPKTHCGANEIYTQCPATLCSPQSCSQLGFPIPCPIRTEPSDCPGPPGCTCKTDFVRNDAGVCIPIEKCPSCGGDPNAVSGCGINCGRLCSNYNNKGPVACPLACKSNGCDCKKGFVFDSSIKKCVRPHDCTVPRCKQNEVYDPCTNGGCSKRNCSQIDEPEKCLRPKKCISGCVCKQGYLRNSDGVCVPEDECPRKCNGPNEYYDPCPSVCGPDTCESIGKSYSCLAKVDCNGACKCKKGFYRNKIGDCISEENCLKCKGRHEFFSCGGACDNVCATLDKQNQTHCPIINIKCNEKCYCEDGYARDDNNICVPIKKCPVRPVCKKHEVYDSCANGGCTKRNCTQKDQPAICIDVIKCIGGCVCDTGYLRDANGKCIPEDQCPSLCKKPNEIYDPCPSNCPIPKCESIDGTLTCPLLPDDNIQKCNGTCLCALGYYRNKIGECHTESDCRKCEGPNEYFSCKGACDNVCSTLSKQNQTNCPLINKKCNAMCYCDEGYARDDNGICIPINQCGVSCNGDPNAVKGCGSHCGKRCSDYNKGPIACPLFCLLNGCDCKQNYVFDDNIGQCVLPKDCTPICKPNESYDFCANGGCRHRNCSDLGGAILCIDPIKCEGGCICSKGYLLAKNGTCVPEEQCPNQCKKPHEVYNPCPSNCPPQTCESLDRAYACPVITCDCNCPENDENCDCDCCKGDCVCEDGYYKNLAGECISEEDCRKCTGEHEYYTCRAPCDNVCATLDIQNQTSCPLDSIECKCFCEEGYARNDTGTCIIIDDCLPPDQSPPASTVNTTEALARLNKGSIALTGEFLYQLLISKPNTNVVASATSVMIPLAQLAYFSNGLVLEQLLKLLNLHSKEEIKDVFSNVIGDYETQSLVTYDVTNKYFVDISHRITKLFMQISKNVFKSGAENVDFSDNFKAADTINDWVAASTHDKITDLVTPDMFSKDTRVVLCNAIYYQGNWLKQFNKNNTKTKDFYLDDKNTVQLPIMYLENSYNYYEKGNIQALEIPYKNSNFSFLVILPRKKGVDAVKAVAERLRNPDVFTGILDEMTYEKVQLHLPRMLVTTSMDLVDMLKKDNVTEMFDKNSDGFSGILETPEPIHVSAAVQKAYISVDETGTEAAAATAISIRALAMPANPPPIYDFNANRPYLFYIKLHKTLVFGGAFLR